MAFTKVPTYLWASVYPSVTLEQEPFAFSERGEQMSEHWERALSKLSGEGCSLELRLQGWATLMEGEGGSG